MAKRSRKFVARSTDGIQKLRQALTKRTKSELIDLLTQLADGDSKLLRRLESSIGLETSPQALVSATRQAITAATDFDARDANQNFAIDYDAYEAAKRGLQGLVKAGDLRSAMELARELMNRGSYQVESSDEGLMTYEIEECLTVVLKAIATCKMPRLEVAQWCGEMLRLDRVGFICKKELESLRDATMAARSSD
jgi:hypothetical protein